MGLEAVMVVVDNSENSRNSDYTPTRYEAQADAVSVIFSAITQANPESAIGLMSMGGRGPEVLVTLTTDHGKILEALHRAKSKIHGESHLATAIQIAGVRFLPCFSLLAASMIMNSVTVGLKTQTKQSATPTHYYLHLQPCSRG
jgi:26S proteasome regulatory subunit N10